MPRASLPPEVVAALKAATTYEDPGYAKAAAMARRNPRLRWRLRDMSPTVSTWAETDAEFSLSRGCMGRLRAALQAAGIAFRAEDRRTTGTGPRPRGLVHRPAGEGSELRWYQQEAVAAGLLRENALLRAPTGSGKTTSAIALAARANVPTLIVVWSSGLFEQWEERLRNELGLAPDEIGRVRGSERVIRPITIAMQQTLWKRLDRKFADLWGMVIVDEVQRAAARTFLDVVDRFPAKYRIGISADETRADRKEFLVYDLFGAVAHEVSQDDLIEEGAVLDVECRIIPTEFRADWYVAQRASGDVIDFHRLLEEMARDEERNKLVLAAVLEEVQAGEQVLVMSHRVEHVQRLDAMITARGIPCDVMLGGDEWRERFEASKVGILSGRLRAACGTIQAIGTGIDLPSLGRGVLCTPIGSNRQLYGQIRGRLCRAGKDDAVLYVLWDRHVQGETAVKNMIRWNRTVRVRADDGEWVDARRLLLRSVNHGDATNDD